MSSPDIGYQQAQYLDYGFLAAKAEQAAKALVEKKPLSEDDRSALKNGSEFLKQVAAGAKALTSGNYQVQNLKGAMEAYEFAADPLEQIGDLLTQADIAQALSEAADVISSRIHVEEGNFPLDAHLKEIKLFASFFGSFYSFARAHIAKSGKAPLISERTRIDIAVHA